ncbi:uncharacterized protein PG998_000090 [Apiospora kogelbergensis]|uniref:uncharacterized protein n=1 Tax=Apiospora kogelbergensis TaxID=1337665 RepID=UPI00312F25AB
MAPVERVDSVHNNIDSENGIPIGAGSRSAGRAIPIAIIGMSGKFGGEATTASKLWDLCKAGSDAWTPIPRDRFDAESLYDKRKGKTGRHFVKGGHFLKDVALFDSAFFNYTTDVANSMDPQIRMLLESVYESVEDAGVPIQKLAGSNTSVFAGSFFSDYNDMTKRDLETLPASFQTGNGIAMFSNRISHFFDFQGASMTIDVGCSTGMVAVHQACQSLRSGESDVSIVGSAAADLSPDTFNILGISGFVGPTGKCFAWDERAEGYGRGEAVASLVLKPLAAALRDGDNVHAVLRETGVNQDGRTPTITSPSMQAQVKLIQDVYRRAGLDPADTGYIEAHMTGTPTGDPIEAEALALTFGKDRSVDDPVLVGSVKPNIGHTEAVSGLAAIIKTVFVLQQGLIPPNANYETPNPKIPLKDWRLQVPSALTPWPAGKLRRASINNFGYGGTNAHIILEAPPGLSHVLPKSLNGMANGLSRRELNTSPDKITNGVANGRTNGATTLSANGTTAIISNDITKDICHPGTNVEMTGSLNVGVTNGMSSRAGPSTNGTTIAPGKDHSLVYILSAKDSTAVQQMGRNLAEHIRKSTELGTGPSPTDLAYTLAERRSRFHWTIALRANNVAELADRLAEPDRKPSRATKTPRLGFVFNGQGAQWHAMARELIDGYPVFRRSLCAAEQILKDYGASWSLQEELLRDEETTRVHEICLSQPISVAVQLCLVDLLAAWGITPTAVTSHSSGEIAAAYAVGALTFQEALGVVYLRGELAQKHHEHAAVEGGMLAAGIGAEAVADYITDTTGGTVVVACHNSPESTTLSGDMPAIDEVAARLKRDGIFARKLTVPLAYHSHHMNAMAKDYTEGLREILAPSKGWSGAIFASPVTGDIVTSPKVLRAEHFVRNLVSPVLFAQAFEKMCFSEITSDGSVRPTGQDANVDFIVEIGAHGTLSGPIRQILRERRLPYVSCLRRHTNAIHTVQDAACALLSHGYPVSLAAVNHHEHGSYLNGLPSYAWNHATTHWLNSRVNREHHYKRFRPHELLGSPVVGSNPQTPTWRNFLRTSDIEWLTDHKLGKDTVLPGAGFVAMAIEAARLLADATEETITGYTLRNVDISSALVIPETTMGIETQLVLHPCSDRNLGHEGGYDFEVWSVSDTDDVWTQHCKGSVTAETAGKDSGDAIQAPNQGVVQDVQPDAVFAGMRAVHLFHGPAFQNLISSRATATRSLTKLKVGAAASHEGPDYVLHPTTLDSIVQAAYPAIPDVTKRRSMVVPRSIRQLYVPRGLQRRPGDLLTTFATLVRADRRGALITEVAVNGEGDSGSAAELKLDGLFCQAVPLGADDQTSGEESSFLCSQTRWEVDITHEVPAAFEKSLQIHLEDEDMDFERRLDRVSFNLIADAVKELSGAPINSSGWPEHCQRLYAWMQSVLARGKSGELGPGSRLWAKSSTGLKQRLADDVAAESAAGRLVVLVGRQLARVVRGEVAVRELLDADGGGLLGRYHAALPRLQERSYAQLRRLVAQYAVGRPGARVLEVGGRMGVAAAPVLEAFAARAPEASAGTLLGHYVFTDVSDESFESVKRDCAPWDGLVEFKTLDIGSDPMLQGFIRGSYDLLVVTNMSICQPDLSERLKNLRMLLKPGGKLVMVETTRARLDTHVVFGGLPSWMRSIHDTDPVVPPGFWDKALRNTGFSGTDLELGDCEEELYRTTSVILTTAVPNLTTLTAYPSTISIVYARGCQPEECWLDEMKTAITAQAGALAIVECLDEMEIRSDVVYVFTAELVRPFLETMDEAAFDQLKCLLLQSQGVLWLSRSGATTSQKPLYAQSAGLLRTARQEDAAKRYVTLDFDAPVGDESPWSPTTDVEYEFAVHDDTLHIPRVYADLERDLASSEEPPGPDARNAVPLAAWPPLGMELGPGVIEIESKAMGLGPHDVSGAPSSADDGLPSFHDAAGVVVRIGPEAEASGLKVGDRVCGLMSWEDAASLPTTYLTSYLCLFHLARLQAGDCILIHAGGGAVGQSAIMLARHVGAEVFTTCSSNSERDLIAARYGMDVDHILSSLDTSFADAIMARTGGRGVDVAINSLEGPLLKATWECMARFGRFVEIGNADAEAARRLELSPLTRSITISGFSLNQYLTFNGQVVQHAWRSVMQLWSDQDIQAVYPVVTYPIDEMESATRRIKRHSHTGKAVVIPAPDAQVQVVTRPKREARLNEPDSTYMIVGGLGGIGLALAEWMMQRGARHILIVSRRAASHPEAEALVRRGRERGCAVLVRNCDVAQEPALVRLLAECAAEAPPVRGVVHAAMALHDTVLERLTYAQWRAGIAPKVAATLHLDRHLPDLRFFVLLSSVTGVLGHTSQANYAAGNTFQDAFARHRAARGLPAVAIDLGAVGDVGVVAASGDGMRERLERTLGSRVIPLSRVIRLVEDSICNPHRSDHNASQVITGLSSYQHAAEGAAIKQDRRFATLQLASVAGVAGGRNASAKSNPDAVLKQSLAGLARDDPEAMSLVMGSVMNKVASIFNLDEGEVDASLSLSALGVDSLVAVDLRNWVSMVLQAKVTTIEVVQSAAVRDFASTVTNIAPHQRHKDLQHLNACIPSRRIALDRQLTDGVDSGLLDALGINSGE